MKHSTAIQQLISKSQSAKDLAEYLDFLKATYDLSPHNCEDLGWAGWFLKDRGNITYDEQAIALRIILQTLAKWDTTFQELKSGLYQYFAVVENETTKIPFERLGSKQWDSVVLWPNGSNISELLINFMDAMNFEWSWDGRVYRQYKPRPLGWSDYYFLIAGPNGNLEEAIQLIEKTFSDIEDNWNNSPEFRNQYEDYQEAVNEIICALPLEQLNIATIESEWKRNDYDQQLGALRKIGIDMQFSSIKSTQIVTLKDIRDEIKR